MVARSIFLIIIIFAIQSLPAQIGAKIHEQEQAICGTWSNNDFPFEMTLVLNQDGSGLFDGGSLKYKIEGNKLVMTQEGKDVQYSYKIQSNSLHLSDGDLADTVMFLRNKKDEPTEFPKNFTNENSSTTSSKLKELKLGTQSWATENLNVTKFRNGDSVQEAKTNKDWRLACKEGKPCWCYYNNESILGQKYGILYNWFAINDPRGLAPDGWHVPSNKEWMTLATELGEPSTGGVRMITKRNWTSYRESIESNRISNGPGVNDFAGLLGGYRNENGKFLAEGISSNWWSSTGDGPFYAWVCGLKNQDYSLQGKTGLKMCGASIRCIKD